MEMLKTAARACLKLFKWASVVAVAFVGVMFAINAFDEPLKPEAAAAMRWPEPSVTDGDNGYFALVGLSAPAGQDAHAWGQSWVEAMNRARSQAEVEDVKKSLGPATLTFAGAAAVLCDFRAGPACAPQAAKQAEAIGKLAADNAELLGRYSAIRSFPAVAETYRPQSLSHPLVGMLVYANAQRLVLSQGMIDHDRDAGGLALATVADDIGLQRKVLAGATSLILKMVADAALARDYLALAEIVRLHPGLAGAQTATLQRVLAPLNKGELALAPAMMSEFRAMAAILDDPAIADPASYQFIQVLGAAEPQVVMASALDAVLAPLMQGTVAVMLQKNATRNRQYEALQAFAALDEVPGPQLGEAERALRERQDEGVTWSWFYNPLGKLILSVAVPDFTDFKRRLLDTEGLRRLVALQVQISAQGIADADMDAFLAKTDSSLANPYTGKPMLWDTEKRAVILVTAKNSRWFVVDPDGRIAVPI